MGKRAKGRNLRLSVAKVPGVEKTKKVAKMNSKKPAPTPAPASELDVEEMLESSVIFTNDGSSRTRSGLKNGESVQRTPTRKRTSAGDRKGVKVAAAEVKNANIDVKSPLILTRTLRVRLKDLSPMRSPREVKPFVPLVEANATEVQMPVSEDKMEEPIPEPPVVAFDEPVVVEDCEVAPKLEPANSVEQISVDMEASLSPEAIPSVKIEEGLKSPQRATYLLKQLQSTLSPKYVNPNGTKSGMPTSRYGRIQKQKENSDYIPLDVAKFITRSPAKFKSIKKELGIEPLSEAVPQPPAELGQTSSELESKPIPPEEIGQISPELPAEPIETSTKPDAPPPEELSDPSSVVEVLQEEVISPGELDAISVAVPVTDPNASLLGIDQIQIIDMDTSFGESSTSAVPSISPPVKVEPPQSPEKAAITDIVPPPAPVVESLPEASQYFPGLMLWGAFNGKTPHWPCMVSPDPDDGQTVKETPGTIAKKIVVHVKFFADNGRRAWIPESLVLPFGTIDQYKAIVDSQFRSLRNRMAQMMRRETWQVAVRQAEDTQSHPIEAREQRYQELLEEDRAKSKTVARRRTKSVSLGYHSNSFDESYESGRKRHRSRTPESPAYEALPLASKPGENLAKRVKRESTEQDLFRSTMSRYFQSMADGSDIADTASGTSSECEDFAELAEADREIYNNFLNMSRLYVFDGQTETTVDRKLQKYVQKICALRMQAIANGARLSSRRLRSQALRKLGRELGIDNETGSPSTSSTTAAATAAAEPKPKKQRPARSLEEQFIFDLEKNYLLKGVPRGSVCAVCVKPHELLKCSKCYNFYHLACQTESAVKPDPAAESKTFTCSDCILQKPPTCFVCQDQDDSVKEEQRYRCSVSGCGKQYHLSCLRLFPQYKFTGTAKASTLFCPNHTCHTCVSDDPRTNATTTKGNLIRCVKCPSSYHPDAKCIPAGSQILSYTAMICPKHNLEQSSLNVNWCFLCCKGGSLICCETCPTAFHLDCLKFTPPEGKYICEECESGRMPLYNEIVWAKCGHFRFWPGITLPPPLVPDNIESTPHEKWDICVRFFGSYDHFWINRRRIYLYQEGDSDTAQNKKSYMDKRYGTALQEARTVHEMLLAKKAALEEQQAENGAGSFKPPMYVKIKSNRYVAPLRVPYQAKDEIDGNVCQCKATDEDPCGLESNCLNRALLVECNPKVCPAGERCQNQCFEKKQYPALMAKRISQKGWGLVANEDIRQGQFVIEYVGEVINNEELARRLHHKVSQKDENYYFLTVDYELTIDAGPKGNLARFINHSCEPNCETMLWKVGSAQSVGLFAIKDIKAGEELTFNYNFESKGTDKKICHCNASKCSGFIGQKYRPPVEEPSGSGIGKRRKSDKRGRPAKRRKSRKSTAEKTTTTAIVTDETTAGSSKRKKKQAATVKDQIDEKVPIKIETAETTAEGTEASCTTTDNMTNAATSIPSDVQTTATAATTTEKEQQPALAESVE